VPNDIASGRKAKVSDLFQNGMWNLPPAKSNILIQIKSGLPTTDDCTKLFYFSALIK